jgi:hypothetical protein
MPPRRRKTCASIGVVEASRIGNLEDVAKWVGEFEKLQDEEKKKTNQ